MSNDPPHDNKGEVCDTCLPIILDLKDRIAGLEYTTRAQAGRIGKLTREDPEKKLREHEFWNRGHALFKVWQRATGHTRSRWTTSRFRACLPYLAEYEDAMICRAIEGIAYDPFETPRANGTKQRHDGWDLLFKSTDRFEEWCNRAPLNWKDNLEEHASEVADQI